MWYVAIFHMVDFFWFMVFSPVWRFSTLIIVFIVLLFTFNFFVIFFQPIELFPLFIYICVCVIVSYARFDYLHFWYCVIKFVLILNLHLVQWTYPFSRDVFLISLYVRGLMNGRVLFEKEMSAFLVKDKVLKFLQYN